jgi:hypothetical protein
MLREAEVVVRAHVQHRRAAIGADERALRCAEHALALVGARGADAGELLLKVRCE